MGKIPGALNTFGNWEHALGDEQTIVGAVGAVGASQTASWLSLINCVCRVMFQTYSNNYFFLENT